AGAALLAAVAALLTWRIALGGIGIRQAAESTMLLGVPVWIAYALMLPSFALLALTAA
ncbi:MAG TPA: TRAP transporter small permease, partial [Rhodocyclaceae bacterium]|nr:TRAP transporter small permease [Rhodocyclaceae bacterium]